MVTKIEAPIVSVTLLEDRAHVTRRGAVEVPAGHSRLSVAGLAPVLADKTLAARLEGASARVLDASVERDEVILDEEKPEDLRAIDERIEALEAETHAIDRELARLQKSLVQLSARADIELDEMSDDAAYDRADGDRWTKMIEGLDEREEALSKKVVALTAQKRIKTVEAGDLANRRAAIASPSTHIRAQVFVDVDATEAGAATLEIEYVVPAACWRPYHTARWIDDGRVEFATDACVWQNTGEDWERAKLSFSTERPSLGAAPPLLRSDVVRATKKSPDVEVAAREEEIQTAGLGGGGTVTMNDVPGIDDGGDPMRIEAEHPATVPSDGRPYRVRLQTFEAESKSDLALMAELTPAVIVRTTQSNGGRRPLLPGPVDLVRNGGLVGRTTVEYVASGERFELGWGPDGDLRVAREVRHLEEESRMLSSWTKMPRIVELQISNIGSNTKKIHVTERVLVSEIEKVKVEVDAKKTTGGKTPDRDGMLTWEVDVPRRGNKKIELRYTVQKHDDVVGL